MIPRFQVRALLSPQASNLDHQGSCTPPLRPLQARARALLRLRRCMAHLRPLPRIPRMPHMPVLRPPLLTLARLPPPLLLLHMAAELGPHQQ